MHDYDNIIRTPFSVSAWYPDGRSHSGVSWWRARALGPRRNGWKFQDISFPILFIIIWWPSILIICIKIKFVTLHSIFIIILSSVTNETALLRHETSYCANDKDLKRKKILSWNYKSTILLKSLHPAAKSMILIASFREKRRKEIDTRLCGEYLSKFRGINSARRRWIFASASRTVDAEITRQLRSWGRERKREREGWRKGDAIS